MNLAHNAFGPHTFHQAIPLTPCAGARVLWVNRRAAQDDPAFVALGGDDEAYGEHLARACAYQVNQDMLAAHADPAAWTDTLIGWADRYGGEGIGTNGGSGRAGVVNGYYVKGIGRTPLIARDAEFTHASGGAYFEESVREAIFGEIVAAEFPWDAVPVLAIIDTGLIQTWPGASPPKRERRVLLVRQTFCRPAHFQRAVHCLSASPFDGSTDARRVTAMWQHFLGHVGAGGCERNIVTFWVRWAEQQAHSFIHRLSHGGTTTSNVAFDGRLVDFGGSAALPSWARITLGIGGAPFGFELQTLMTCFMDFLYYITQNLPRTLFSQDFVNACLLQLSAAYKQTFVQELLQLAGIGRAVATAPREAGEIDELFQAINAMLAPCRAEAFDIFLGTPAPAAAVHLERLWDDAPARTMAPLRDKLERMIGSGQRPLCRARSSFLARPRTNLYREELKARLFGQLEAAPLAAGRDGRRQLAAIIAAEVAHGRRRSRHAPADMLPAGFAVADDFSLALFHTHGGQLRAMPEWCASAPAAAALAAAAAPHGADHQPGVACALAADGTGLLLGAAGAAYLPCVLAYTACAAPGVAAANHSTERESA